MSGKQKSRVFVLRLRAPPGLIGIHGLRVLLKVLLRRHQLRCVSISEE
jgi:hypothetical protein